ncbi:MAG: hypothetical protein Q7J47_11685 [Azoarcus sp.]|nr:hypothetical protein [Azoarcus sp.]
MPALTPEHLLTVWEQSARRHPIDRALLLFAIAAPHTPPDTLADQPLGVRNAALMALRRDSFGARLDAWADCAACGERLEFVLDSGQLPPAPTDAQLPLEIGGHRFRRPTSRNLARLAGATDADAAARQLLHDCAESAADLPRDPVALRELLDAVDAAMDAADPWADLTLGIRCPACGHEDEAVFDIGAYLWDEIDSHARRLLDDIHTLALAYGWTEPEILALSDTRRAAYLDRVQRERIQVGRGQFERGLA